MFRLKYDFTVMDSPSGLVQYIGDCMYRGVTGYNFQMKFVLMFPSPGIVLVFTVSRSKYLEVTSTWGANMIVQISQ